MIGKFRSFYENKILNEMALYKDKAKLPINFDEDDIEFLHQFPQKYWHRAIQARYEMFFDVLEKAHKERSVQMKPIQNGIKKGLKSGDWDDLKQILPSDIVEKLKIKYASKKGYDANEEAEREAWEIVKPQTDRVDDPQEAEFKLNLGKDSETFVAKPFLNRLYHKLERTRGLPHLPGSGLEGKKGRYGYFMHNPQRAPKIFKVKLKNGEEVEVVADNIDSVPNAITAKGYDAEEISTKKNGKLDVVEISPQHAADGIKFPAESVIKNRLQDFLSYNGQRAYGELPGDAEWLDSGTKDTSIIPYLKSKIQRDIEADLRRRKLFDKESDLAKEARRLVNEKLVELAQNGELRGPPIPGKFPQGIPVEVDSNGKIIPPPLYLPYHMKDVKTKGPDGQINVEKKAVPILNPSHYFRQLGTDASDYSYDDDGKIVYDPKTGAPVWNPQLAQSGKLRGHDQKLVHLDDEEYEKSKTGLAPGAMHVNKSVAGQEYLSPGDDAYEEAFENVFGSMETINFKGHQGFYKDIIMGTTPCWNSESTGACGAATKKEKEFMALNIDLIHSMVVQKLKMNLRNEEFWGKEKNAIKKRANFAFNVISSYAQKDLVDGSGTRRLRNYRGHQSLDATGTGSDGSSHSTQDAILAGGVERPTLLASKRGRGERRFKDDYMEILKNLNLEARKADSESIQALELSKNKTGQDIINLISNSIKDKSEVADSIREILINIYSFSGNSEEESQKMANEQLSSWLQQTNSATELVGLLQQHPMAVQFASRATGVAADTSQEDGPLQPDEQEAIDKLHKDLTTAQRENGHTLDSLKPLLLPKAGQHFGTYVMGVGKSLAGVDRDRISHAVQKEINNLYAKQNVEVPTKMVAKKPNMPSTVAPTVIGKNIPPIGMDESEHFKQLLLKARDVNHPESYLARLALAKNNIYTRTASIDNLRNLLAYLQKNQNKYNPTEYQSTIAYLNSKIKSRMNNV